MSSYKIRGTPVSETVKSVTLSMLKCGRIFHTSSIRNKDLIHAAHDLLSDIKLTNDIEPKYVLGHLSCMYMFNDPIMKWIRAEYPIVNLKKLIPESMLVKKDTGQKKIYYSQHVTPESYKKHGTPILLTSKYYSEECFAVEGFIDDLISVDRPLSLPITNEVIRKVIDRITFLIKNHEEYWIYAVQELYSVYIKRIYGLSNLGDFDISLIKELLEFQHDSKIEKMVSLNKFPKNIPRIPPARLAYILGAPTGLSNSCYFAPSIDKIFLMVERMKENPEQYLSRIKEKNIHNLTCVIEATKYTYDKCEICNTENLLGENILDYHDFDILHHCDDDGHIYSFTRDEFPAMIERGNNPYNEVPFPRALLQSMKNRSSVADLIGRAKTVKDLWEENKILSEPIFSTKAPHVPPKTYTKELYNEKIIKVEQVLIGHRISDYTDYHSYGSRFNVSDFVSRSRAEERGGIGSNFHQLLNMLSETRDTGVRNRTANSYFGMFRSAPQNDIPSDEAIVDNPNDESRVDEGVERIIYFCQGRDTEANSREENSVDEVVNSSNVESRIEEEVERQISNHWVERLRDMQYPQGTQGLHVPQYSRGTQGTQGFQGPPASQGTQGFQGPAASQGTQGFPVPYDAQYRTQGSQYPPTPQGTPASRSPQEDVRVRGVEDYIRMTLSSVPNVIVHDASAPRSAYSTLGVRGLHQLPGIVDEVHPMPANPSIEQASENMWRRYIDAELYGNALGIPSPNPLGDIASPQEAVAGNGNSRNVASPNPPGNSNPYGSFISGAITSTFRELRNLGIIPEDTNSTNGSVGYVRGGDIASAPYAQRGVIGNLYDMEEVDDDNTVEQEEYQEDPYDPEDDYDDEDEIPPLVYIYPTNMNVVNINDLD